MRITAFAFACLVVLAAAPARADEYASGKVADIGCHVGDDTCFVTIAGYVPTVCNRNPSVRWNAGTSAGKRWYATFLAAQISGKSVSLSVPSGICSSQGFPTFNWGVVK